MMIAKLLISTAKSLGDQEVTIDEYKKGST